MSMHNYVTPWLVFTGLVLVGVLTFAYRILRDRDRVSYSAILKLLISNMLLLMMAISTLPSPVPHWLYLVRVFCVQFGLLLTYLAADQFFNNKPYQSLLRNRHFLVIGGLALVGLVLVHFRRHASAFEQPAYVSRPWAYYSSYLINYSIYLYLLGRIIRLYWRGLRTYHDLAYLTRLFVCMCGFIATAFSMMIITIYDLLGPTVAFSLQTEQIMRGTFLWGMMTSVLLLTIGFAMPHWLVKRAVQPFERVLVWRQERRRAAIRYLHRAMTRIVPGVQLHDQRLRDLRMLIEISDARQIIWSRQPHPVPITAEVEAAHLAQLLASNMVIDEPGEHHPPRTKQPDIVKHNLAVARLLKRQLAGAPTALRSDMESIAR